MSVNNKRKIVKEYTGSRNIKIACLLGFHVWDYDHNPVYCINCGKIR